MYIHLISFFVISNTKEKKLRSCKFLLFFNQFLHTFMKNLKVSLTIDSFRSNFNNDVVNDVVLVFLLLTLNILHTFF